MCRITNFTHETYSFMCKTFRVTNEISNMCEEFEKLRMKLEVLHMKFQISVKHLKCYA